MKILPTLVLLFPIISHSNEVDVACDLEKSKAEIVALTSENPFISSSIGNDENNDKTITIGISQSLSGKSKARHIRSAANAKCNAISAVIKLEQAIKWSILEINQAAAEEELKLINEAIILANSNLKFIQEQLETKNTSISQYSSILEVVNVLEKRKLNLEKTLAVVIIKVSDISLTELVEMAKNQEALTQSELAKASADSGWDIIWSVGAKQTFEKTKINDPSKPQNAAIPQIQILFKYSFGAGKASNIAKSVEQKTKNLLESQELGFSKTIDRLRRELVQLVKLESATVESSSKYLKELTILRQSVQNVDSFLGQNSYRDFNLRIKILQADYYSSQQKRLGYVKLLDRLKQ